jgi:hypothetical protein
MYYNKYSWEHIATKMSGVREAKFNSELDFYRTLLMWNRSPVWKYYGAWDPTLV